MKITKAMQPYVPCLVLRDQREKANKWQFPVSDFCAGTKDCHLVTGDYTLQGFEDKFAIERKGSVDDFVQSLTQQRFKEELHRLSDLPHAFLILEFTMDTLYRYPATAGLHSESMIQRLPLRYPGAAFAAYMETRLKFPNVDFVFADSHGKHLAGNIFKRIIEAYAK